MYATVLDMITRFGADELIELANRQAVAVSPEALDAVVQDGDLSGFSAEEVAAAEAVEAKVEAAIADAGDEIDPYLQTRHQLPLENVPRILVRYACDIARYILHGDSLTEVVAKRYSDATTFLGRVAAGRASLGLDAGGDAAPADGGSAGSVHVSAPARTFTDDTLRGYTG